METLGVRDVWDYIQWHKEHVKFMEYVELKKMHSWMLAQAILHLKPHRQEKSAHCSICRLQAMPN